MLSIKASAGTTMTALTTLAVATAMVCVAAQSAPAPTPPPAAGTPGAGRAQGQGRGGGGRGIQAPLYPVLPIGSDLPDFSLPGVDGRNHTPQEFRSAKVLAVMFESNHCPASLAYQERAHQLLATFKSRGYAMILINPNNPKAVRLNELGYTDMSDSFDEMKVRAKFNGWTLPYLYDGETQKTAMTFGAVATPHIFIFDQQRKLRYQGAIDDNRNAANVKQRYAADAIEALLSGKPVPTPETRALGCSTKWIHLSTGVDEERQAIESTPVTLSPIDVAGLKTLRENATNKTMVVSFWRTGDKVSEAQFADLQTSFRMYSLSPRPVDMVIVSTDAPGQSASVLAYLQKQHATSTNRQWASTDMAALQSAFGMKWNPSRPFTVVIDPAGKVAYQREGAIDIREVRRVILSTVPDNPSWPMIQNYYRNVLARMASAKR